MEISVYILSWRDTSEFQPRTKNGHAAHSTTGVDNTNCIHPDTTGLMDSCKFNPGRCSSIARTNTGRVNASPIQKRRVMSMSSALGTSSTLATSGSSAMPQMGHAPGPICRIWGCMGQV